MQVIAGKVSYLGNSAFHIVQCDYNKGNYPERYRLIDDDRFVVNEYLKINEYGAWRWHNADNKYVHIIEEYFYDREDWSI